MWNLPLRTHNIKLDFSRSYSKIDKFNLMQTLNLTSLTDDKLQHLAQKIPEMKQISIYSMNSTSTNLTAYTNNFWSSVKVKTFSAMGTLVSAFSLIVL